MAAITQDARPAPEACDHPPEFAPRTFSLRLSIPRCKNAGLQEHFCKAGHGKGREKRGAGAAVKNLPLQIFLCLLYHEAKMLARNGIFAKPSIYAVRASVQRRSRKTCLARLLRIYYTIFSREVKRQFPPRRHRITVCCILSGSI